LALGEIKHVGGATSCRADQVEAGEEQRQCAGRCIIDAALPRCHGRGIFVSCEDVDDPLAQAMIEALLASAWRVEH